MESLTGHLGNGNSLAADRQGQALPRFMNVRQVADYLHLNEKKIYSLVNEGNIPATKVTGKWMFPRDLVDRWLLESSYGGVLTDRLAVAGGDDPLLSRVIMNLARRIKAQAHISYSCTGTALGLSLLARHRADICAVHWGPADESQNRHAALINQYPQHHDWALVRICRREQGLMVRAERQEQDLGRLLQAPLRWVVRQQGSGSQRYLQETLSRQRLDAKVIEQRTTAVALSEREAASQLAMNIGDIAPGARSSAREYGLAFVSVGWEAFDLVLYRGVYFRRLFRELLDELRSDATLKLAASLGGYEFTDTGRVIWAE
ncbi:MAG: helix-turn-helix transcriptional regulator [Aquisalimonadaceae bacterium]